MLSLPPSVRIYFATTLVDMRNGIDGLRAMVESALKKDPYGGHLFVFVGKSKDKVKILFWDRNGFVLYLKRLERGRFQLPAVDERTKHVAMEPAQGPSAVATALARRSSIPDRESQPPPRAGKMGASELDFISRSHDDSSRHVLGQRGTTLSLRPFP